MGSHTVNGRKIGTAPSEDDKFQLTAMDVRQTEKIIENVKNDGELEAKGKIHKSMGGHFIGENYVTIKAQTYNIVPKKQAKDDEEQSK